MSVSVSLSTRVLPELRERLVTQARGRGVPLATLARNLLAAGLDGADGPGGGGQLVNEVNCVFAHFPPESAVRREVCLTMARTAELGGAAGVTAGRALLDEIRVAEHLYQEYDDEEAADWLA
jgi:hypothetical protein